MKILEIRDEYDDREAGILLYYEKSHCFIVELTDGSDEWTAPFMFASYAKKGTLTIPRSDSLAWVRSRIIPPSRQNIDMILRNHHLKEYDEMKFLELSEGRCSQDSLYVKPVAELPEYVRGRQERNVTECCILAGRKFLCIFADDTVRRIDMNRLAGIRDVDKIVNNVSLSESCKVGAGGYFITFNNSIDIPAETLYKEGDRIMLTGSELIAFARNVIADTTQACDVLGCSRQNISYMVRQGYLVPVKEGVKGNLYLKGDVMRNLW